MFLVPVVVRQRCPGFARSGARNGSAVLLGMGPQVVQEWGRQLSRNGAASCPGMGPPFGPEWVRHRVRNEFEKLPGLSQFFSGIGPARKPCGIGRCSFFSSRMVVLAFPALRFGAFFSRTVNASCPGMGPQVVQEWGSKLSRNGAASCPGMGPLVVEEWGRKLSRNGAAK